MRPARHLAEAERRIEAQGLLVAQIDLQRQPALEGERVADQPPPDSMSLPAGRDEEAADEILIEQADETHRRAIAAGEPALAQRQEFLVDQRLMLDQPRPPQERMRQKRGIEPDRGDSFGIRLRVIGADGRHRHRSNPVQTPRASAATPVRAISIRPSGRIRSAKASILSGAPVISKTKLSSVESTTLARKISARRSASIRASPLPATFRSASSRCTDGPSTVRSLTVCT